MSGTDAPEPSEPKIFLLPNMMTAGNLLCGFFAVLTIFTGISQGTSADGGTYDFSIAHTYYQKAILLIFASCIFDLLDGRVARMGGQESPFGREFDSIADIVSFGIAPALLLSKAVLFELQPAWIGWGIASIYLLCGALRLARFNCLAAMPKKPSDKGDFVGLPIPMAAGGIAAVVFLIIEFSINKEFNLNSWKYPLAVCMLVLSFLMISKVKFPSFKKINWKTKGSMISLIVASLVVLALIKFPWVMPAILFICYLLYGLIRPWITRRWLQAIEDPNHGDSSDHPDEEP